MSEKTDDIRILYLSVHYSIQHITAKFAHMNGHWKAYDLKCLATLFSIFLMFFVSHYAYLDLEITKTILVLAMTHEMTYRVSYG